MAEPSAGKENGGNMGSRRGHRPPRLGKSVFLLALALLALGNRSHAQSPDLREIQPFIAIIVDSSGSMERLPGCVCSTRSCAECLPDCSLSNDSLGKPPPAKKNRWSVTLEALTGTFDDFQCRSLDRVPNNGMTYDLAYFLPYHQPWSCTTSDLAGGSSCKAYPSSGTSNARMSQQPDGILDTYSGRVRFGLMTFDGWGTYRGAAPLVPHNSFDYVTSGDVPGLWSYGSYTSAGAPILRKDGSQPGRFHYPNCATDYMIDTGIRGPQASEGGLVSLNSALCATPPCDSGVISTAVQKALLDTRPYGGTPIAASLDDLYYHINKDLGSDVFGGCRSRYGLLITDGYPDDDFRAYGCDCTQNTDPTAPGYCGGGSNNPSDMFCPYPKAEDVAYQLVNGRVGSSANQDNPPLQKLFVVGLSIVDPEVRDRLNLIAQQGNSDRRDDGNYAVFADDNDPLTDDLEILRKTIDNVVAQTIEPVSRSVPLFIRGKNAPQYQISTGFDVAAKAGDPWVGFIERKRYLCQGSTVVEQAISTQDQFHNLLKAQNSRTLLTVNARTANDSVINALSCGDCSTPTSLDTLTPPDLGLSSSDVATFDATMAWMYGASTSPRSNWPISDIYHSSPVVLTAPADNSGDESFNLFRRRNEVRDRPMTLFINSNDGILHAFAVEDWTPTSSPAPGSSRTAGEEMWGFVPPMFLNDLPGQLVQHKLTMDGTPVIKDVYFKRSGTSVSSGTDYHTVLITGMRGGGSGYVALDVTNVHTPKFLWQFTDNSTTSASMGLTYGQAAITQASYRLTSGPDTAQKQGAVAILSGGYGTKGVGTGCNAATMRHAAYRPSTTNQLGQTYGSPDPLTSAVHSHRTEVPCWENTGRALFFVDVETGILIKKLDERIFPSPLVGTPSVYTSDVGTVGTRAFVMDADGVLWRIDMSGTDPMADDQERGWTARPFHDLFWDRAADQGETSYEAPILTTNPAGQVVVIVGTGNTDNFEKTDANNRAVSLTEFTRGTTTEVADRYWAGFNWEMRVPEANMQASYSGFEPSELITGRMVLHEGQLFMASYISVPPSDPCDMGLGRFWSLHYNHPDQNQPTGSNPPTYGPLRIAETGFNVPAAEATPDLLVMGLAVTQRPECSAVNNSAMDPIFGYYVPPTTTAPAATYVVAQAAGSGATKAAGSALKSVQLQVRSSRTPAVVTSWGGSVE